MSAPFNRVPHEVSVCCGERRRFSATREFAVCVRRVVEEVFKWLTQVKVKILQCKITQSERRRIGDSRKQMARIAEWSFLEFCITFIHVLMRKQHFNFVILYSKWWGSG